MPPAQATLNDMPHPQVEVMNFSRKERQPMQNETGSYYSAPAAFLSTTYRHAYVSQSSSPVPFLNQQHQCDLKKIPSAAADMQPTIFFSRIGTRVPALRPQQLFDDAVWRYFSYRHRKS